MRALYIIVCIATGALAACSQGTPTTTSSTPKPVASTLPGNVCERKLLTLADVDGILDEPVTGTKPLAGDAQTCLFVTAKDDQGAGNISVSLRGNGVATLATFTSGKMNQYANWKSMSGVGDEGVWLPELHEVDARKGDSLCVVGVAFSMSKALRDAGEAAQQRKLGGLCNKIFASN